MKAIKQIVGTVAAGCVLVLSPTPHVQAQDQKSPPGTYYSTKDFEWKPPLPFNPHPELDVVEIEPGIFLIDDTMIPDTPEQAAARAAHEAAVEHAKAIAANPALAEAERAARQAAQEAVWKKNREEIEPWLVSTLPTATGEPATRESMEAASQSELVSLAASLAAKRAATLQAATNMGTPTELVFDNGERAFLAGFEGGQPVWNMSDGITQAVSIATSQVWPGGGAGYALAAR